MKPNAISFSGSGPSKEKGGFHPIQSVSQWPTLERALLGSSGFGLFLQGMQGLADMLNHNSELASVHLLGVGLSAIVGGLTIILHNRQKARK